MGVFVRVRKERKWYPSKKKVLVTGFIENTYKKVHLKGYVAVNCSVGDLTVYYTTAIRFTGVAPQTTAATTTTTATKSAF